MKLLQTTGALLTAALMQCFVPHVYAAAEIFSKEKLLLGVCTDFDMYTPEVTLDVVKQLLDGGVDLLRTGKEESRGGVFSCLTCYMHSVGRRLCRKCKPHGHKIPDCTAYYGNGRACKPGSDDTSVLQLLLKAALDRGQLHRLLEVGVDSDGGNVFHQMCFGVKPVQLQTLLGFLALANRSPLVPGCELPGDVCALIRSFLPSPIDHQDEYGETPLMAFCQTTVPMVRLLVQAGADLGPMHRLGKTVLDHARRQTSAQARDIVAYLESINAPSNALFSSSSSEASSSELPALNMEDAFM